MDCVQAKINRTVNSNTNPNPTPYFGIPIIRRCSIDWVHGRRVPCGVPRSKALAPISAGGPAFFSFARVRELA